MKDWLFQLIRGAWIVRRIREKPAISDISESTYAKVTYFYRLLLVVTLGIPVMPRVNTDLKLYYKLYVFVNSTNPYIAQYSTNCGGSDF